MFLLSVKAGLRAKEIANLKWSMVVNSDGMVGPNINLTDNASKGRSGRSIPINRDLKEQLKSMLEKARVHHGFDVSAANVIDSERGEQMSPQAVVNQFRKWYLELGLTGCSSHSGRRTFITNAARKISTVGGSLRDVQFLAGHSSLNTTQRYIEGNSLARIKIVDLI